MNIIEPVAPITGTASLTVTCAAPCVNATGAVTLNATHTVATFTLTPGTTLAPGTLYTGTITGATALSSGVATAGPYTWQFTTVGTPSDLTRPQVSVTAPATTIPGPTAGVPSNTAISATFTIKQRRPIEARYRRVTDPRTSRGGHILSGGPS